MLNQYQKQKSQLKKIEDFGEKIEGAKKALQTGTKESEGQQSIYDENEDLFTNIERIVEKDNQNKSVESINEKDQQAFESFLKEDGTDMVMALKNPAKMNDLVDKFRKRGGTGRKGG